MNISNTQVDSKIIVALDYANAKQAYEFVDRISPKHCQLKVGKEMFTHLGPDFVSELVKRGYRVFLDLKYHDIPNTVAKACQKAADLGVWMINVHASGGRRMMEAAKEALSTFDQPPMLIAVTVLTSLSDEDLAEMGYALTAEKQVVKFAQLAESSGLDGVVCSPMEIAALRQCCSNNFNLITPGIRPESSKSDDQKRVMTPQQACSVGANYLVIGRPITQSEDPVATLKKISESIV
jgi:orotidine-5'-phosphate decarboxylase